MDKASEWIKDAITCAGSPCQVCDFCQRTHYVGSGLFMDDGELDELIKKEEAEPSKYVSNVEADSISYGQIEGRTYVWNCGCEQSEERLARIENFIWTHRHLIHSYFVRRGKARAAEAQEVSDTLKGIQEMMI